MNGGHDSTEVTQVRFVFFKKIMHIFKNVQQHV